MDTASFPDDTTELLPPASPHNHQSTEAKISKRLLPPLVLLITFSFIDRTNLAFASLQMNEDLNFSPSTYGLASGMFFVGYALFQIPSNIAITHIGASTWLAALSLLWGICATCFAAIRTPAQFIFLRFLLGVFESGAIPGMWYYLALFYPPDRLTLPYSLVETSITASQILAAPTAAALLSLDGSFGLRGWQWVFLIEGVPTILLAAYLKLSLPDSVATCSFLTPSEKSGLLARIGTSSASSATQSPHDTLLPSASGNSSAPTSAAHGIYVIPKSPTDHGPRPPPSTQQLLLEAASNWKVWYAGAWRILHDTAGYGVLYWTPKLVQSISPASNSPSHPPAQSGNFTSSSPSPSSPPPSSHARAPSSSTGAAIVLLTAIPFAAASLFHVLNAWHSQKSGDRRWHIVGAWAVGGFALLLLPTSVDAAPLLAFLLLVLGHMGVNGANGCQTAWVAAFQRPRVRAVGLALYNTLGNAGGFIGPYVVGVMYEKSGGYGSSMVLMGVALLGAAVMVLGFRDASGDRPSYTLVGSREEGSERASEHVLD